MFQVFRRLGTIRIIAKLGNRTGGGRQAFYNKVSDVSKNYETCTNVLKCCNTFQCLQEDSEFDPIRIDPLNCEGFGGPSRDKLVSQVSGIPVMGGVTGGKKIIVSGIPVMGGVTGGK